MMEQTFWIDPRDKGALLIAVMRELAGDDSSLALEAESDEMDALDLNSIAGSVYEMTPPFSHQWRPDARAVVLPLTVHTVKPIYTRLVSEGRFVRHIGAIQIQRGGEIQFLVGDNFHRECVSCGPGISEAFLDSLLQKGIIRSFKRNSSQAT
jgi:hypothetical protein